jgi:hypothetical protein
MYRIKWRNRKRNRWGGFDFKVYTGMSVYQSAKLAGAQADRFKSVFPQNEYYIVPS